MLLLNNLLKRRWLTLNSADKIIGDINLIACCCSFANGSRWLSICLLSGLINIIVSSSVPIHCLKLILEVEFCVCRTLDIGRTQTGDHRRYRDFSTFVFDDPILVILATVKRCQIIKLSILRFNIQTIFARPKYSFSFLVNRGIKLHQGISSMLKTSTKLPISFMVFRKCHFPG